MFLELGDKQSLLASLKESQFFKAFEDQGITYEVRAEIAASQPVGGAPGKLRPRITPTTSYLPSILRVFLDVHMRR